MALIKAKIEFGGIGDRGFDDDDQIQVDVVVHNITSFYRDKDGSVVIFTCDGKRLRTTLSYSRVEKLFK